MLFAVLSLTLVSCGGEKAVAEDPETELTEEVPEVTDEPAAMPVDSTDMEPATEEGTPKGE